MQVPVSLEPIEGGRFRAPSNLFGFIIEGATEEEATTNYRDAVAARLLNGGKFVSVDLPDSKPSGTSHPWMKFAGTLPDDELTQEWKQAMAEHRREMDIQLLPLANETLLQPVIVGIAAAALVEFLLSMGAKIGHSDFMSRGVRRIDNERRT